MNEHERRIHEDRQGVYGDWRKNMAATTRQMEGLLAQMLSTGAMEIDKAGRVKLPDWAFPLVMAVACKGNRIAGGHFHPDNFDDAGVYLAFVRELQEGEEQQSSKAAEQQSGEGRCCRS